MERPNILLLYTDQQRWDTLRCAGNELMVTPNLDNLAAGGALFHQAYTNCPVCMPARQSMLSGRYPSVVGTTTNGIEFPPEMPHLATLLSPYGYHTGNLGKLHFRNHAHRDHREPHPRYGFDTLILSDEPGCYDDAYIAWVAQQAPDQVELCRCTSPPAIRHGRLEKHPRSTEEPYIFEGREELTHTAFVAEETCSYIRAHRQQPFFAIAGFYAPHAPVNPPGRFVEMYDEAAMPLPAWADGNPTEHSDDHWRKVKAYYYALVTHIDDQVGRILETLDDCELSEKTIVIFTSDHGDYLGDHGRVGKGPPGHDACARVPFIISWPGHIEAGRQYEALIEQVDVVPTLLDFCGIQIPSYCQGRSLRPLLTGGSQEPRSSAFIEFREPLGRSWKTVVTAEYMYTATNRGEEVLYDRRRDPAELRNVADDRAYGEAKEGMRAELLRRWFDVESQYPLKTGEY